MTAPHHMPERQPTATVFISYSSADERTAMEILKTLEAQRLSCWLAPREILTGWWPRQIVSAIGNCRLMLLVLSKASSESPHVRREVILAADAQKPILPFQIDDAVVGDDLKYYLAGLQTFPAGPGPPSAHYEALAQRVDVILGLLSPETARHKVTISWGLLGMLVVPGILLIALAVWCQLFTNIGAWAYLIVTGVFLAPLVAYHLLLDEWKGWARAMIRSGLLSPSGPLKAALAGINLLLAMGLASTAFIGVLGIAYDARELQQRRVTVQDGPRVILRDFQPGETKRFQHWAPSRHAIPATITASGLGEAKAWFVPWSRDLVSIPAALLNRRLLLVIPHADLPPAAGNRYYAHIAGGGHSFRVLIATDGTASSVRPFWIGCEGSVEVRDEKVRLKLEKAGAPPGPFECRDAHVFDPKTAVTVTLETEGGLAVQPDSLPPGLTVGEERSGQDSILISRGRAAE